MHSLCHRYIFSLIISALSLTLIIGCGSSSSAQPPVSNNSNNNPDNIKKYDATSYTGRLVSDFDLHGLWIMAGSENISITNLNTGETDSGVGQHREIFAIRRVDNEPFSIDMRMCGSSTWFNVSKGASNLSGFSALNTTFSPVSSTRIQITRSISDPESTINGTYTAIKISDDPELNIGKITLLALISDQADPLQKILIANNETFNIYCFTESNSPVGIPKINDNHILDIYYKDPNNTYDENNLLMVSTDFKNNSFFSEFASLSHQQYTYGAAGEKVVIFDYVKNDESGINMTFDTQAPAINSFDTVSGDVLIDL